MKLTEDEPETVWDWTLTPIARKEEPDMVEYLLVSAVEITEQSRVRQQAEELNRLKDEFLSLASHELRTPLTSIQGNAELLHLKLQQRTKATGSSDQDRQAVERIMRQAGRLNRLIDEMLDATRIQGEVLELKNDEDVNLVEVTRRVIDAYAATGREINLVNLATGRGVGIDEESGADALIGNWDEARLEQVLHNLLSNALKYSLSDSSVQVGLERRDNEAVVSVKDQGRGLSAEEQTHIFERFYRLSRDEKSHVEGLGLGLYITQQIVTRFGGHIWVESQPGDGSTFFVALPLKQTENQ